MVQFAKVSLILLIIFLIVLAVFSFGIFSESLYNNSGDFIDQEPVSADIELLPLAESVQKGIEIDLKKQKMTLWFNNQPLKEYTISTGKKTTPTRTGNFSIIDKYPIAEGVIQGVHWTMPYFMGVYFAGATENGIHELPLANGYRESPRDMGWPVSHGCVRLNVGDAQEVYNWTEVGTPVWIHR